MKIEIEISDYDAMHINALIDHANRYDDQRNSHGRLSFAVLGGMLFEDVALARRRPGSWEGTNMMQLLISHGYDV